MFKRYQHVERFGTDEVDGIELGNCHIFPKIDGTNGSIWLEDDGVHFGSRNMELLDHDNQGFKTGLEHDERIIGYLANHRGHRLFGEWLVPHSLKTYRDEAWKKFYVFDVCVDIDDGVEYLPYEVYTPLLEEFGIEYIPLLAYTKNATYEQLVELLEKNTFLVKDGLGTGEGVVIKNYSFKNRFDRTTWAKIVKAEFKEIHSKTMGAPIINGEAMVEEKIVEKYLTSAVIEKEYQKIAVDGWKSEYIPKLFGVIYHTLVTEEIWNILKEFNKPKIDFKTLNHLVIQKVKSEKREIFS